jgi:hypothetical protein
MFRIYLRCSQYLGSVALNGWMTNEFESPKLLGFWILTGIIKTVEHNVWETVSVSILRWVWGDTLLGRLERTKEQFDAIEITYQIFVMSSFCSSLEYFVNLYIFFAL